MTGLLLIDATALIFFTLGFHLAFRQRATRRWLAGMRGAPAGETAPDDGAKAVLLMVGVMVMTFSFTAAAFANLIAYYGAHSPN